MMTKSRRKKWERELIAVITVVVHMSAQKIVVGKPERKN
jgi:hypothetical protein